MYVDCNPYSNNWDCSTSFNPCNEGDRDSNCSGSLVCGNNNCIGDGFDPDDDCCTKSAWVRGDKGQTCEETCSGLGRTCDSEEQSKLTTNEKVAAAFLKAGYTCKNFYVDGRDYAGTPFSSPTNNDRDCARMKKGSESVCNANNHGHHYPLCFCRKSQLV